MMIGSAPTAARTAAISSGEQTIARAPPATATLANPTAESNADDLYPTSATSSSDREVKIVTPVMRVCGIASTAALTMERPPEA